MNKVRTRKRLLIALEVYSFFTDLIYNGRKPLYLLGKPNMHIFEMTKLLMSTHKILVLVNSKMVMSCAFCFSNFLVYYYMSKFFNFITLMITFRFIHFQLIYSI